MIIFYLYTYPFLKICITCRILKTTVDTPLITQFLHSISDTFSFSATLFYCPEIVYGKICSKFQKNLMFRGIYIYQEKKTEHRRRISRDISRDAKEFLAEYDNSPAEIRTLSLFTYLDCLGNL